MTKKKMLVFDQIGYAVPYKERFDILNVVGVRELSKLHEALAQCDVVLYTGGSDVSPLLYGEPEGKLTTPYPERDKFEKWLHGHCVDKRKPILGICRGHQFIHVMNGGKLIQHVSGHVGGYHMIEDVHGNNMMMSSAHHQMVNIATVPTAVVIAKAKGMLSTTYLNGWDKEIFAPNEMVVEPEIVYYPKTNSLGIQGHPEYSDNKFMHNYCMDLLDYYVFKTRKDPPKYKFNDV